MPRVIDCADQDVSTLAECTDALLSRGFDPRDEESLAHAALQLRRLGNDSTFLGDLILAELAANHRAEPAEQSYGPQVIMLSRPGARGQGGDFFLRANIWPSASEHMMRASGAAAFVYGLPHDHNFDFLTLGYFGPGYWSDYYEYDYASVTGWRGEPVELRFVERSRLEQGKLMHYRAHVDVHRQLPADSLSVSLNVMHAGGAQGWLDQYRFDVEGRKVAGILGQGASEAFMRIAVGLGGEEALDLAERFGRSHPSDRMRLAAWDALASAQSEAQARDSVWHRAELAGSRLVAAEARLRRGYSTPPVMASIAP
jgi:hypothetical protein